MPAGYPAVADAGSSAVPRGISDSRWLYGAAAPESCTVSGAARQGIVGVDMRHCAGCLERKRRAALA